MAGWGAGSGHRIERRRAVNVVLLCNRQLASGRKLLLEAGPKSGAWDLAEYQGLISQLTVTQHAFSNYNVKVPGRECMMSRSIQFASSFNMMCHFPLLLIWFPAYLSPGTYCRFLARNNRFRLLPRFADFPRPPCPRRLGNKAAM